LNKPTLKPYTFAIATANAQKPKLQKSMSCLRYQQNGKRNNESLTKYKNNSRNISKYEHCSPHQH